MAHHDVRACAQGGAADAALLGGEIFPVFASPVKGSDDDLASRLTQRLHIPADVFFPVGIGETVARHADFDAILLIDSQRAVARYREPRDLQIGNRVFPAGLSVIKRMVVGDVDRLYAAQREDIRIFGRAL